MPTTNHYEPKHRAVKHRVFADWKRLTALGATLPAALGGTLALGAAPAQAASEDKIAEAVAVARDQKGDDYEYGADGPDQFDCSGLLQYSFGKAGINLPRTSGEQADAGERIPRSELQPGDLIAFHSGGDVYHISIYTGRQDGGARRIIEAANEDTGVHSTAVWDDSWYAVTLR